jgi:hypothetical protein
MDMGLSSIERRSRDRLLVEQFRHKPKWSYRLVSFNFDFHAVIAAWMDSDLDEDGYASNQELQEVLVFGGFPIDLAKEATDGFFKIHDQNNSGLVEKKEFIAEVLRMQLFRVIRSFFSDWSDVPEPSSRSADTIKVQPAPDKDQEEENDKQLADKTVAKAASAANTNLRPGQRGYQDRVILRLDLETRLQEQLGQVGLALSKAAFAFFHKSNCDRMFDMELCVWYIALCEGQPEASENVTVPLPIDSLPKPRMNRKLPGGVLPPSTSIVPANYKSGRSTARELSSPNVKDTEVTALEASGFGVARQQGHVVRRDLQGHLVEYPAADFEPPSVDPMAKFLADRLMQKMRPSQTLSLSCPPSVKTSRRPSGVDESQIDSGLRSGSATANCSMEPYDVLSDGNSQLSRQSATRLDRSLSRSRSGSRLDRPFTASWEQAEESFGGNGMWSAAGIEKLNLLSLPDKREAPNLNLSHTTRHAARADKLRKALARAASAGAVRDKMGTINPTQAPGRSSPLAFPPASAPTSPNQFLGHSNSTSRLGPNNTNKSVLSHTTSSVTSHVSINAFVQGGGISREVCRSRSAAQLQRAARPSTSADGSPAKITLTRPTTSNSPFSSHTNLTHNFHTSVPMASTRHNLVATSAASLGISHSKSVNVASFPVAGQSGSLSASSSRGLLSSNGTLSSDGWSFAPGGLQPFNGVGVAPAPAPCTLQSMVVAEIKPALTDEDLANPTLQVPKRILAPSSVSRPQSRHFTATVQDRAGLDLSLPNNTSQRPAKYTSVSAGTVASETVDKDNILRGSQLPGRSRGTGHKPAKGDLSLDALPAADSVEVATDLASAGFALKVNGVSTHYALSLKLNGVPVQGLPGPGHSVGGRSAKDQSRPQASTGGAQVDKFHRPHHYRGEDEPELTPVEKARELSQLHRINQALWASAGKELKHHDKRSASLQLASEMRLTFPPNVEVSEASFCEAKSSKEVDGGDNSDPDRDTDLHDELSGEWSAIANEDDYDPGADPGSLDLRDPSRSATLAAQRNEVHTAHAHAEGAKKMNLAGLLRLEDDRLDILNKSAGANGGSVREEAEGGANGEGEEADGVARKTTKLKEHATKSKGNLMQLALVIAPYVLITREEYASGDVMVCVTIIIIIIIIVIIIIIIYRYEQAAEKERQTAQQQDEQSACWLLKKPSEPLGHSLHDSSAHGQAKKGPHCKLADRASSRWLRETQLRSHPSPVDSVFLSEPLQARIIADFARSFSQDDLLLCVVFLRSLRAHCDFNVLEHSSCIVKKKLMFVDNHGATILAGFQLPQHALLESIFRLEFSRPVMTFRNAKRELEKLVSLARYRFQRLSEAVNDITAQRLPFSVLASPWIPSSELLSLYDLLFVENAPLRNLKKHNLNLSETVISSLSEPVNNTSRSALVTTSHRSGGSPSRYAHHVL